MNEEEKKAIEYLKARLYGNEACKFIDVAQTDLRIFLKLVEKQQKEIKELNKLHYDLGTNYIDLDEKYKQQQKEIERLNGIINSRYYHDLKCRELEKEINEDWENKIKNKIKQLEKSKEEELKNDDDFGTHTLKWAIADYVISVLKELLEEK